MTIDRSIVWFDLFNKNVDNFTNLIVEHNYGHLEKDTRNWLEFYRKLILGTKVGIW